MSLRWFFWCSPFFCATEIRWKEQIMCWVLRLTGSNSHFSHWDRLIFGLLRIAEATHFWVTEIDSSWVTENRWSYSFLSHWDLLIIGSLRLAEATHFWVTEIYSSLGHWDSLEATYFRVTEIWWEQHTAVFEQQQWWNLKQKKGDIWLADRLTHWVGLFLFTVKGCFYQRWGHRQTWQKPVWVSMDWQSDWRTETASAEW